ncbi:hypothetical protein V8G54_003387 [Vigna mungo]|uniref:Importin N-terminal domain-containing protein n=1 Tax=Vigna mungo TaxID=3915 RepID=A0AAQ3SCY3_VIGMU
MNEQNLPSFLFSLAGELANDDKPAESRKLAGLILKNALDAKEQHRKIEFVQRWLALDPTLKAQIKAFLLRTLSSPSLDARSTASQDPFCLMFISFLHLQGRQLLRPLGTFVKKFPQM